MMEAQEALKLETSDLRMPGTKKLAKSLRALRVVPPAKVYNRKRLPRPEELLEREYGTWQ